MASRQNALHILLLEDDPHLRRGIALALELQKFTVHQAGNGHQGLEIMRHSEPDLIISDINMPLMDGVRFLKSVQSDIRSRYVPFVFLTGKDAANKDDRGDMDLADDFITKPINTVNLLRVIYRNLLRAAGARHRSRNAAFRQDIERIAITLESRDELTDGHIHRVTDLAVLLGERMGWPRERLEILEFSAMLHDIGKITVPDYLLNKTGSLTPEEWRLLQRHTITGAEMVAEVPLIRDAAPHILAHHEKWDGSGYPNGWIGTGISAEARILAVVDAFDGMTSDRPYRRAMPVEATLAEIRQRSGKDFDPAIVQLLLEEMQ